MDDYLHQVIFDVRYNIFSSSCIGKFYYRIKIDKYLATFIMVFINIKIKPSRISYLINVAKLEHYSSQILFSCSLKKFFYFDLLRLTIFE